jgi:hypothetical protein
MKRIAIALIMTTAFAATAYAAPPASCARKVVGVWSHQAGYTTIYANGTAYPHCCWWIQTWNCKGNRYTFRNPSGATWTQRLTPNGRYLVGAPFDSARVRR